MSLTVYPGLRTHLQRAPVRGDHGSAAAPRFAPGDRVDGPAGHATARRDRPRAGRRRGGPCLATDRTPRVACRVTARTGSSPAVARLVDVTAVQPEPGDADVRHHRSAEIDLDLVEELTRRETAALDEKHARRSRTGRRRKRGCRAASELVAVVAAASDLRQARRGLARLGHRRQRVRRLPQRLRRDGDGARAPEDRRGRAASGSRSAPTSRSRPRTRSSCADNLAERYRLPLWRFGNSGTESTLDAMRIMRAVTGRKKIVKVEGTYHGHHDSLMVWVFPSQEDAGPREHPGSVPQTPGCPTGSSTRSSASRSTTPRRSSARSRSTPARSPA